MASPPAAAALRQAYRSHARRRLPAPSCWCWLWRRADSTSRARTGRTSAPRKACPTIRRSRSSRRTTARCGSARRPAPPDTMESAGARSPPPRSRTTRCWPWSRIAGAAGGSERRTAVSAVSMARAGPTTTSPTAFCPPMRCRPPSKITAAIYGSARQPAWLDSRPAQRSGLSTPRGPANSSTPTPCGCSRTRAGACGSQRPRA